MVLLLRWPQPGQIRFDLPLDSNVVLLLLHRMNMIRNSMCTLDSNVVLLLRRDRQTVSDREYHFRFQCGSIITKMCVIVSTILLSLDSNVVLLLL